MYSIISFFFKWEKRKEAGEKNGLQRVRVFGFRERESGFSLRFRAIQPSNFFGARSKVVLRSEGFAWIPVWRSFDKLCDVGVFILLEVTLCLSVL